MKIKSTYIVQYRKPYTTNCRLCKLYKCFDGKRTRWFVDDNETVEEINRDFAGTLKRTPV